MAVGRISMCCSIACLPVGVEPKHAYHIDKTPGFATAFCLFHTDTQGLHSTRSVNESVGTSLVQSTGIQRGIYAKVAYNQLGTIK